ncbi:MAG: hypothetical protein HY951_12525 [Bacteroidia bacterium]|nr:hypothetical protein [Bacteroidia bacterium]
MKQLLLVPILFLSLHTFCQKLNFEKIALKFVVDSEESFLKRPSSDSKILIISCSQSANIFWDWELQFIFSKSDSTLIRQTQIQCNKEISNLTDEFHKIYPYDSTSYKNAGKLSRYLRKNAKCSFIYDHCRNTRIKLNNKQKQIFSFNGYRYAKENAGMIYATSPYFINNNEFAIVLVDFCIKDISNMEIYVFIDMNGKILRYYCVDDKQKGK